MHDNNDWIKKSRKYDDVRFDINSEHIVERKKSHNNFHENCK